MNAAAKRAEPQTSTNRPAISAGDQGVTEDEERARCAEESMNGGGDRGIGESGILTEQKPNNKTSAASKSGPHSPERTQPKDK